MIQNNNDNVTKEGVPSSLEKFTEGTSGESRCKNRIWTFVNYEIRAIR